MAFVWAKSDFDHFKIDFRNATVWAGPVIWNIFPFSTRDDPVLRPTFRFVVNPSTNDALIFFHVTLQNQRIWKLAQKS